jgi:hypothetical protein
VISANLLIVVVIAVVVLALLVVLAVAVRAAVARSTNALPPPEDDAGVATGMACPFCKRRYDPSQTGGRCPGCGAAAPRR